MGCHDHASSQHAAGRIQSKIWEPAPEVEFPNETGDATLTRIVKIPCPLYFYTRTN